MDFSTTTLDLAMKMGMMGVMGMMRMMGKRGSWCVIEGLLPEDYDPGIRRALLQRQGNVCNLLRLRGLGDSLRGIVAL